MSESFVTNVTNVASCHTQQDFTWLVRGSCSPLLVGRGVHLSLETTASLQDIMGVTDVIIGEKIAHWFADTTMWARFAFSLANVTQLHPAGVQGWLHAVSETDTFASSACNFNMAPGH